MDSMTRIFGGFMAEHLKSQLRYEHFYWFCKFYNLQGPIVLGCEE
jgi:hypothetical protein